MMSGQAETKIMFRQFAGAGKGGQEDTRTAFLTRLQGGSSRPAVAEVAEVAVVAMAVQRGLQSALKSKCKFVVAMSCAGEIAGAAVRS